MPKSVHIKTPWPTEKEMVRHLRISQARKRELAAILDKAKAELSRQEEAPVISLEPGKKRKRASAA
jgi:hypothetical protein